MTFINREMKRVLTSMLLFMLIIMVGAMQLILGFMVIGLAETTIIPNMNSYDWILVMTGSIFVFSTFLTLQFMRYIK